MLVVSRTLIANVGGLASKGLRRFPVKPKSSTGGKMHSENHCDRTGS